MMYKLKKLLIKNIINAVETKIAPALIDKIMEQFKVELLGKVSITDPTAPEHFEKDFLDILIETVNDSLIISSDSVSFSLRDNSKLGYSGDIVKPVQTMVFLLEGILGQYAFITLDIYEQHRKKMGDRLGRFGGGFLITKDLFFKEHWDRTISWNKARWGFSNAGPINVFEIDNSIVNKIIDETIKNTINEFSAQLRAEHKKR